MWDAMFAEDEPEEWLRLREVMIGHCHDLGRDPAEVSCSSHLRVDPKPDPDEVADRCARMFEHGIDVAILGLNAAHDGSTVESLATALARVR
jgi:hypothetical protein